MGSVPSGAAPAGPAAASQSAAAGREVLRGSGARYRDPRVEFGPGLVERGSSPPHRGEPELGRVAAHRVHLRAGGQEGGAAFEAVRAGAVVLADRAGNGRELDPEVLARQP